MRPIIIAGLAAAVAVSLTGTGTAIAKDNHGRYGNYQGDDEGEHDGNYGAGYTGWCPPGLAKKHNGCRPPGHVKIGDRYDDYEYQPLRSRDSRYDFFRIGDLVVSADKRTGRILHLFDALGHELQ